MALFLGAAMLGGTLIGAKTSKDAADKQADGVKKSIASTEALSKQAREDAIKLYSSGMIAGRKANQRVIDFYTQSIPNAIKPLQQGNVLGQKALISGMNQANNALMGLPVDTSGLQAQQINADYGFLKNLPAGQDQTSPSQILGEPQSPIGNVLSSTIPYGLINQPVVDVGGRLVAQPQSTTAPAQPAISVGGKLIAQPQQSSQGNVVHGLTIPAAQVVAPKIPDNPATAYYKNIGRVS